MDNLPHLQCEWLSKEQAEKRNYRPYFGYCIPSEYWMLSNAEKDLIASGKEYVAVAGNIRGVMIWVR
jgi:hypothetical protein